MVITLFSLQFDLMSDPDETYLLALFHQGKPFPKTEQKFENYAKSAFRMSDRKVSIFLVLVVKAFLVAAALQ